MPSCAWADIAHGNHVQSDGVKTTRCKQVVARFAFTSVQRTTEMFLENKMPQKYRDTVVILVVNLVAKAFSAVI